MKALRSIFIIIFIVIYTIVTSFVIVLTGLTGQFLPHQIQRLWGKCMLLIMGARVRVIGMENIDKKCRYIFVGNHQSHIDIPTLFSIFPQQLTFIAKKELFAIPVFGWGMRMLGHISIDRSSARKARDSFLWAVKRLKTENISLVIFPEGTRSPDGFVAPFKRGSFSLVVESGLPVVPVAIQGTRRILPKKGWIFGSGEVLITIGKPMDLTALGIADKEQAALVIRKQIIALGVNERLNTY